MPAEADRHRQEIERLHQGLVVELDRRSTSRAPPIDQTRMRVDRTVDEEVASSISVIHQVALAMGEQQETIQKQEELIYEQRQSLAELQHQKQTAYAELTDAERAMKTEQERADRAESRVHATDAQVRRLEDYSVSLKSHLNSLMMAVRDNLAIKETSHAD